jgi:hypothetical protein
MVRDLAARRMHHACCARRSQREPDFFRSMLTARCQDAILRIDERSTRAAPSSPIDPAFRPGSPSRAQAVAVSDRGVAGPGRNLAPYDRDRPALSASCTAMHAIARG